MSASLTPVESDGSTLEPPKDVIVVEDMLQIDHQDAQMQPTFCRICLQGPSNGKDDGNDKLSLISPCTCKGSLAKIHKSCLEHWLSSSNTNKCEICQFLYDTREIYPTFKDYLLDPENVCFCRNLMTDVLCCTLLTPVLVISLYLCYLGANQHYFDFSSTGQNLGFMVLSILLVIVYLIWLHVMYKYHSTVWRKWKATHRKVKLVLIFDDSMIPCRIV